MTLRRITFEHLLYSIAILLALTVRLGSLGGAPLSEAEAGWALSGLETFRPVETVGPLALPAPASSNPAYTLLTGVVFAIFGSSDAAARLLPALAGSLLALLPLLFRRDLGSGPAAVLALCLALDPGLVTVSRQAGGPMPALTFSLLALGLWRAGAPVLAGLAAGLALLSGPAFLIGAVGLALALGATRFLRPPLLGREQPDTGFSLAARRTALLSAGGTLLLVGTLFAARPAGFAGLFEGLPAYFSGWIQPSGIPAARLLAALPVYTPLALLFGAVAVARAFLPTLRRPRIASRQAEEMFTPTADFSSPPPSPQPAGGNGIAAEDTTFPSRQGGGGGGSVRTLVAVLLIWTLAAVLVPLLYPARQVADLIWALPPLWTLAALELARPLFRSRSSTPSDRIAAQASERDQSPGALPGGEAAIAWGAAALLFILLALFWLTLSGLNLSLPGLSGFGVRTAVLAGILVLGALAIFLVALGWSWAVAREGLFWGVLISMGVYTLGAMWSAAYNRQNSPVELWSVSPAPGQARLAEDTLHQISTWRTGGFPQDLDVVVSYSSQALRWMLRDNPQVRFSSTPAAGDLPAVIITAKDEAAPSLATSYRGQDFVWQARPGWNGALPPDPARWLTFREAPLVQESIILWARSDLFPGGILEANGE